jgi:outer membrane protein assembly factor BamE
VFFRVDAFKGNVLPEDRIKQLKIGMNRDEVNYILGTPVLVNIIDTNETQYVYTFKKDKGDMSTQKLILTFQQDRLTNIS